MVSAAPDPAFIQHTYWIVLGRAPSRRELDEELRGPANRNQVTLLRGLLSSREFGSIRSAWRHDREPDGDPAAVEAALAALGSPEAFVEHVYASILGRTPDPDGSRHYATLISAGEPRRRVVRALALSDEFSRRWQAVPRDHQLCELANPAKWDNEEWLDILRELGLSDDKLAMHRKPYEFAQLIFGCRTLGALDSGSNVLSVGAGHELVLYWLANHVRRVVASDRYEGVWSDRQGREGDPAVLRDPDSYAPFPYQRDRLVFVKVDGRHLAFASSAFDVVYSLSSIEHFGGVEGAANTVREMARVLRPGGVLALATEYVLKGPPHEETFQPEEVARILSQPGLELVEPIDDQVYRRYTFEPVDLHANPFQTPHMVVRFGDTVFTTVMAFLRKC